MAKNIYLTIKTPLSDDTFEVIRFEGEEMISGLYRYVVELGSGDVSVDFSALLGKSVTVTIESTDASKNYFNGIVARMTQRLDQNSNIIYILEVVPKLWLLTKTRNYRIFPVTAVADVMSTVMGDYGITDYSFSHSGKGRVREQIVQYDESSFDFLSRLMEDDGVYYYFTHADGTHTMKCLGASPGTFEAPSLLSDIRYGVSLGEWIGEDELVVDDLAMNQEITTNKYEASDYNYKTPSTDLYASVTGTDNGAGTTLTKKDYPGGYLTQTVGEGRAGVMIESEEYEAKTVKGRSYCRAFHAGAKFTLKDHPRADMNTTYVLRRVQHHATQESYYNTFEAFPASLPFRPPRMTKRPVAVGHQIATVIGDSESAEFSADSDGRVLIKFPWASRGDSNAVNSCYARVAQMWAGKSWGSLYTPRVKAEVVVTFLDGDPERPIIVGTLYNEEQALPYAFPDAQTRSTIKTNSSDKGGGFNEFRFEDKKDAEEVFLNAHKDYNTIVGHDQVDSIKNSRQVFVQPGDPTLDKEAKDVLVVEGSRKVTVKGGDTVETHTNEGKYTQAVTKEFTLTVDGKTLTIEAKGDISIKGKSITLETTGGDFKVKSAMNVKTEASMSVASKAGTELKNEAGTSMTNKASISMTNDGGATLTNKASGMQKVDGGGMLEVKGGIVKIN